MYNMDNYKFQGKRALVRVDFNVPFDSEGNISDNTRIITALPTIRKILSEGGSVIIMTHLGRPKGKYKDDLSCSRLVNPLQELLRQEIKFFPKYNEEELKREALNLKSGEILLLENLRFNEEELEGGENFASFLASLGDVYVNNAFGTAHRAHASTYTIAKFFPYDRIFGYLIENERKNIDKLLKKSKPPFTAIIGGSKISTKLHIIEALIEKVDRLIIGGGIAFTFIKALGGSIGNSIVEDDYLDIALNIIDKAKKEGVELLLPIDCIIGDSFDNGAKIDHCPIDKIPDNWMGLDIGVKTGEKFSQAIMDSSSILWNGPMGAFEMVHFSNGTLKIAMSVARATDKGAYSLIGGGDSISAVNKFGLAHKISYISTAGGALLEYIEGKKLPGIRAIEDNFSLDQYNFKGKRALIRVDFNVPLNENLEITDDTRIITALSTIRKVLEDGGSVIIITHLGRPKGKFNEKMSLKHICSRLNSLLGLEVKLLPYSQNLSLIKEETEKINPGEVFMLENIRFYEEETNNDEDFSQALSALGDVYINNAFGTAHRKHASTYGIAKFFQAQDRMPGYLVENEIFNINRALNAKKSPFTAIIGGSKISTKIDIIDSLIDKADNLIVGGAIVFNFIKAMGGDIGSSLYEEDYLDSAKRIIEKANKKGVNLYLPDDCLIANSFDNNADIKHSEIDKIPQGWQGMDIGIHALENMGKIIEMSKTILWNGPMGVFEMSHFSNGTLRVAMSVARATDKGAFSLVGGGDSIAALNLYALAYKISYISTAGGALLEYIRGDELPSLKAIKGDFS